MRCMRHLQADARGFVAKVSDFGLSQLQPDKSPCSAPAGPAAEHASDAAGTVTHMAPEMLQGGPGSCASDVYSYGVLGDVLLRSALLCCVQMHATLVSVPCPCTSQRPFVVHAHASAPIAEEFTPTAICA